MWGCCCCWCGGYVFQFRLLVHGLLLISGKQVLENGFDAVVIILILDRHLLSIVAPNQRLLLLREARQQRLICCSSVSHQGRVVWQLTQYSTIA